MASKPATLQAAKVNTYDLNTVKELETALHTIRNDKSNFYMLQKGQTERTMKLTAANKVGVIERKIARLQFENGNGKQEETPTKQEKIFVPNQDRDILTHELGKLNQEAVALYNYWDNGNLAECKDSIEQMQRILQAATKQIKEDIYRNL